MYVNGCKPSAEIQDSPRLAQGQQTCANVNSKLRQQGRLVIHPLQDSSRAGS
jgi:hypothetical protein